MSAIPVFQWQDRRQGDEKSQQLSGPASLTTRDRVSNNMDDVVRCLRVSFNFHMHKVHALACLNTSYRHIHPINKKFKNQGVGLESLLSSQELLLLSEDLSQVPSTQVSQLSAACNSSFMGPDGLFRHPHAHVHAHKLKQTQIHVNKNKNLQGLERWFSS